MNLRVLLDIATICGLALAVLAGFFALRSKCTRRKVLGGILAILLAASSITRLLRPISLVTLASTNSALTHYTARFVCLTFSIAPLAPTTHT